MQEKDELEYHLNKLFQMFVAGKLQDTTSLYFLMLIFELKGLKEEIERLKNS